jgi:hypothetical protein
VCKRSPLYQNRCMNGMGIILGLADRTIIAPSTIECVIVHARQEGNMDAQERP